MFNISVILSTSVTACFKWTPMVSWVAVSLLLAIFGKDKLSLAEEHNAPGNFWGKELGCSIGRRGNHKDLMLRGLQRGVGPLAM